MINLNTISVKACQKLLVAILSIIMFGCNYELSPQNKVQHGIASPTLSHDNSQILFTLCNIPGKCNIAFYDIANDKLTTVNYTNNADIGSAVMSRDGSMLTFTSGEGDDRNIFIVNSNGTNLQQLTHTYNSGNQARVNGETVVRINGSPFFSPDGKRIIYKRSGVRRQRSMGGEMLSRWDIYELEIATRNERQLTAYEFYHVTSPFYLPDGKGFIFSGSGPKGADLPEEMEARNGNEIMIMREGQEHPQRAFEHPTAAYQPTVVLDGTIAFVSRTNEYDGTRGNFTYDIFIHQSGQTRRLTSEKFAIIASLFISFDGSKIVFLASKTRDEGPSIWLAKVDGTETRNIDRIWKHLDSQH